MNTNKMNLISYNIFDTMTLEKGVPDGVNMIGAPKFWEKGRYGENVTIAVIDTGCDIYHPNLKDRIIGVKNFTNDDKGKEDIVTDYIGHGTHVAGIIAASDIGSGVVGVAPKANLLIIKALGKKGGIYNWVIEAVNYAVKQKVDIISMSVGGKIDDNNLHKAIKSAVKKNILVVCAAGNEGDGKSDTTELSYPAAYNEVISVGSISTSKESSRFSSSNKEVDLVAPGQGFDGKGILSTAPGGKYAEMEGTSMATPHVSGALALIINWAKNQFKRNLTEPEIYAQLIKNTISLGYDKSIEGNGMLFLQSEDIMMNLIHDNKMLSKILS